MLGSPILYLKGMRILMFQLSGFYYTLQNPNLHNYYLKPEYQLLGPLDPWGMGFLQVRSGVCSGFGDPDPSTRYGSFRKLGVPYFGGPYNKDPTI